MTFTPFERARPREGQLPPDSIAEMSHADMDLAIENGEARYLSRTMNMFALHESVWWMADRDGWFRVSSQELVDQLAVAAERLDQAEAAIRK